MLHTWLNMKIKEKLTNKYLMNVFDSLTAGDCSATRDLLSKHLPFLKEISSELKKFDKGKEFDDDIYFLLEKAF